MEILVALLVPSVVALLWEQVFDQPIRRFLGRKRRQLKRVQRIKWPDDQRIFEESWRIYSLGHPDLLDEKQDVVEWLREDAARAAEADIEAQEIWLVARDRRRRMGGMLYATFYARPSSRCFVWHIGVDNELRASEDLRSLLWEELRGEVYACTSRRTCEYFFEDVAEEDTTGEADRLRRRAYVEFLSGINARKVDMAYVIPDTSDAHDPEEEFDAELFYVGTSDSELDRDATLEFIYGTVNFWLFVYGRDEDTFEKLERRVEYYRGLITQLQERNPGQHLPLAPIEAGKAH